MSTGITYYSDFKNLSSITSPLVDNNVGMRYKGSFIESSGNRTFNTPSSGLKKTKYNKGLIYCSDASKLFSIYKGHIGLSLQFNDDIINGVYNPIANSPFEYFIFGVNIGSTEISCPSISAKLTKDGIKFTISSSFGQYSIIDNVTNISSGEMAFYEFIWDSERIYSSANYTIGIPEYLIEESSISSTDFWATMCIKVNNYATVIGNPPIGLSDSLSNVNFYVLDTPYNQSGLECIIGNLTIANGFIEEGDGYESSSSSSHHSVSSSSSSSKSSKSVGSSSTSSSSFSLISTNSSSSSSSTQDKWFVTNEITDFIPTSIASSNGNSYIYVVGTNGASDSTNCSARIYKSIDSTNFSDITINVSNSVANVAAAGTRFYEIKCDPTGQTILLGQQGGIKWTNYPVNDPANSNPAIFSHTFDIGKILISHNYGNTWTTITSSFGEIQDILVPTTDYTIENCLAISSNGNIMAVSAANVYTSEARIFVNNSSGSGNWSKCPLWNTGTFNWMVAVNNNNEIKIFGPNSDIYGTTTSYIYDSYDLGNTWYNVEVKSVDYDKVSTIISDNSHNYASCVSENMRHLASIGYYLYLGLPILSGSGTDNWGTSWSTFLDSSYNPDYPNYLSPKFSLYSQLICDSNCSTVYFADKTNGLYKKSGLFTYDLDMWDMWDKSFKKISGTNIPANPRCISGSRDLSNVCTANITSPTTCTICYR